MEIYDHDLKTKTETETLIAVMGDEVHQQRITEEEYKTATRLTSKNISRAYEQGSRMLPIVHKSVELTSFNSEFGKESSCSQNTIEKTGKERAPKFNSMKNETERHACFNSFSDDTEPGDREIRHMAPPPSKLLCCDRGLIDESDLLIPNDSGEKDLIRATIKLRKAMNANMEEMHLLEDNFFSKKEDYYDHVKPLSQIEYALAQICTKFSDIPLNNHESEEVIHEFQAVAKNMSVVINDLYSWVHSQSEHVRCMKISVKEDIKAMTQRQIERLAREELQEQIIDLCDEYLSTLEEELLKVEAHEKGDDFFESEKCRCDVLPPIFLWMDVLVQYKRMKRGALFGVVHERKKRKDRQVRLERERLDITRGIEKIRELQTKRLCRRIKKL